jgi:hypothetical protein
MFFISLHRKDAYLKQFEICIEFLNLFGVYNIGFIGTVSRRRRSKLFKVLSQDGARTDFSEILRASLFNKSISLDSTLNLKKGINNML